MSTEPSTAGKSTPQVPAGMPVFGASGRKIVYDEDGKPCRTCNTLLDFKSITKGATTTSTAAGAPTVAIASKELETKTSEIYAKDEPADVVELGRASWTFLHSVAARYPDKPSEEQQTDLEQFVRLFSKFYPCWFCAKDFKGFIEKNKPKVKTQEDFGRWLCDAHNEVNVKLGKPKFDCNLWKQRWKDGWDEETK